MTFSDLIFPTQWVRRDEDGQVISLVVTNTTYVGVTGLTTGDVTLDASKQGAAFASLSDGTWSELEDGVYTITLDGDDCDTLGTLLLRVNDGTNPVTLRMIEVGLDAADGLNQYLRIRNFFKERK